MQPNVPINVVKRQSKKRVQRSSRNTDNRSLETALIGSAILLWIPYSLAAFYVAYCRSFFVEESGVVMSASDWAPRPTVPGIRPSHSYSKVYYYFFPDGFDIAAFMPLLLRVAIFSSLAVLVTYLVAVRVDRGGELLMVVAWVFGALSEWGWLTSANNRAVIPRVAPVSMNVTDLLWYDSLPTPPGWLWLAVSLVTGFFSGILCKVKDIVDGKHDRNTHLFLMFEPHRRAEDEDEEGEEGEQRPRRPLPNRRVHPNLIDLGDRIYMVVPFCTGQWFAFISKNGWRGIVVENGTIVLSLAMVGYTMLSYQLLKRQVLHASGRNGPRTRLVRRLVTGPDGEEQYMDVMTTTVDDTSVDLIDLVSKLFTTSFGAVVASVIAVNIFLTSLAIPFLKALFSLNALVSSVGIIVELIMYEVA